MSLGLSDLNKKRRKAEPAPSDASTPEVKKNFTRSKTARPWSEEVAQRTQARGRPRADLSDIAVNEDWMSLHTEPIFWIDLNQSSIWLGLNERLAKIEAQVQKMIWDPVQSIRRFFRGQK